MRIVCCNIKENHTRADTDAVLLRCAKEFALRQNKTVPESVFHTENGKPYVKEDGIFIGAAHTCGRLFAAACEVPFGIDAESTKRNTRGASKIAAKYFSCGEQKLLMSGEKTFAEIWTAKESFLKLTGEGLAGLREADTVKLPYVFEYMKLGDILICVCSKTRIENISAVHEK